MQRKGDFEYNFFAGVFAVDNRSISFKSKLIKFADKVVQRLIISVECSLSSVDVSA